MITAKISPVILIADELQDPLLNTVSGTMSPFFKGDSQGAALIASGLNDS
jgi:hypothetical protein